MADHQTDDLQPGDIRVYFAAERTMLAWVRTGVTLMGLGFVVSRFGLFLREIAALHGALPQPDPNPPASPGLSVIMGAVLLVIGVGMNLYAMLRFASFARRFRRGAVIQPPSLTAEFIVASLLALIGLVLAIYLVTAR